MTNVSENKLLKKYIFCNRCKNETNHVFKAEHYRDYPNYSPDGDLAFVERLKYRFWVCAGCERGILEEFYTFDVEDNEIADIVKYYPKRTELYIEDKFFKQLPSKLNTIYRETLGAFNNNLNTLCAIGIRTLLEGICEDKKIPGNNLKTKIDNMVNVSLPKNVVTSLHNIRFIGNKAAHNLALPAEKDIRLAIEICEDILNYLYELDYKASQLANSRQQKKGIHKN